MIIRVTGQVTIATGEGRGRCYALDVALRHGADHRPSALSDDQAISA